MVATYSINSPLNRQERTNLNDSLQDALSRLNSLQRQINTLSGGVEIEALLNEISETINNANTSIGDINVLIDRANQYLAMFEQKERDVNEAITLANNATASANRAVQNLDGALQDTIDQANTTIDESLQNNTRTVDDLVVRTESELNGTIESVNQTIQGVVQTAEQLNADLSGYNIPISDFNISNAYIVNQAVRFNGTTYRAKTATQNNPLPNNSQVENTWWTLEAQRGVDGDGAVSSVAGKMPSIDGNVDLTPQDITALGQEHLADQVHRHVEIVNELPTDFTGRGILFRQVGATSNAPERPSYDKILESVIDLGVNVKQYGAIGDGTSHPLRELYTTLTLAQIDYPFATSLSDEIDGLAIQKAILTGSKSIFIPEGQYQINTKITLSNTFGRRIYGVNGLASRLYFKYTDTNKEIITIENGSFNCTIEGLGFVSTLKTGNAIRVIQANGINFTDLHISGFKNGILFDKDSGWIYRINRLSINECDKGINSNAVINTYFNAVFIDQLSAWGNDIALDLGSGHEIVLINSHIEGNRIGILKREDGTMIVENTYFESNSDYPIWVSYVNKPINQFIVKNCYLLLKGNSTGVRFSSNQQSKIIIKDNLFVSSGDVECYAVGQDIYSGQYTFKDNQLYGVGIRKGANSFVIGNDTELISQSYQHMPTDFNVKEVSDWGWTKLRVNLTASKTVTLPQLGSVSEIVPIEFYCFGKTDSTTISIVTSGNVSVLNPTVFTTELKNFKKFTIAPVRVTETGYTEYVIIT